jgi:hypothetical protein
MEVGQLLECAVCLEVYEDPRIIPCFHTFCLECVGRLLCNKGLTCPLCRATHELSTNASELPRNLVAQSLADSYKHTQDKGARKPPSKVMCDSEDSKEALKWCQSCQTSLCDTCWEGCHAYGKLRSHTHQPINARM